MKTVKRGGAELARAWVLQIVGKPGDYVYDVPAGRGGLVRVCAYASEEELWRKNQWADEKWNREKYEAVRVRVADLKAWEDEMNAERRKGLEERRAAETCVSEAAAERMRKR